MIKFGRHGVDVQGNLRRTSARRESSWPPNSLDALQRAMALNDRAGWYLERHAYAQAAAHYRFAASFAITEAGRNVLIDKAHEAEQLAKGAA
jgi:hypothetical protein